MKCAKLGFGICAVIAGYHSYAMATSSVAAPAPATSPHLLHDLQAELNQLLQQQDFPGATFAVAFDDGRLIKVAAGFANVERGQPMTPDTRILAASIGKTFVGALAVQLAAENRISLDAPLKTYLGHHKWYKRLPNGATVTIRQLLQHRGGIENHYDNPRFFKLLEEKRAKHPNNAYPITMQEKIDFVLDRPPLFPPGAGFAYSDIGYILVGLAIERATKRPLFDQVKERLITPVALTLTEPSDRRMLAGLAQGYAPTPGPLNPATRMVDDAGLLVYDPAAEYAGGGLISNSGDIARWAVSLYGGRLLSDLSVATIIAPPEGLSATEKQQGRHYGLGTGVMPAAEPMRLAYAHSGYIMGYRSTMRYYPRCGFAIAMQINTEAGYWDRKSSAVDIEKASAALANVVAIKTNSCVSKEQS